MDGSVGAIRIFLTPEDFWFRNAATMILTVQRPIRATTNSFIICLECEFAENERMPYLMGENIIERILCQRFPAVTTVQSEDACREEVEWVIIYSAESSKHIIPLKTLLPPPALA